MRGQRRLHNAGLWLAVSALASMAAPAAATDLIDAWRAAQQHDLDFAVSRAAQQAGEARRGQAGALWRPNVVLSGTAGVAGSDTAVNGAQFSAPSLGTSDGLAFNTSVNRGTLGRWALSASLPLISRERDAQGKQLLRCSRSMPLCSQPQAVEPVMSHIDEPRVTLLALGVDFRETAPTADLNQCCSGGAGTFLINLAAPLGHKAWQIESLIELVAAQLPGPLTP